MTHSVFSTTKRHIQAKTIPFLMNILVLKMENFVTHLDYFVHSRSYNNQNKWNFENKFQKVSLCAQKLYVWHLVLCTRNVQSFLGFCLCHLSKWMEHRVFLTTNGWYIQAFPRIHFSFSWIWTTLSREVSFPSSLLILISFPKESNN